MNKLFLIIAMLSATCTGMQAKVRLHHLIGDNMVVQADSKVNLWGWDTPGKTVTVSVSWSKARYTARAAADGKWLHFDYVPEEHEGRFGPADYTGRLCVIGAHLDEHKLHELFGL